jgi:TetR/AcrR family fatty acid metabolism transcriptional regulator
MEILTNRRTIILQATLDLVAEYGLLNTTISLIARQAKSSPGIIYHYFESKNDIIHCCMRSSCASRRSAGE